MKERLLNKFELINFMKKIEIRSTNECWHWKAYLNNKGYGVFRIKKNIVYSHRLSYFLFNGNIKRDLHILHKCDNEKCVNPFHLFEGTHKENMLDSKNKNRRARLFGELNSESVLTKDNVTEIRNMYSSGDFSQRQIAKIFGVGQTQIWRILNRISWKHI